MHTIHFLVLDSFYCITLNLQVGFMHTRVKVNLSLRSICGVDFLELYFRTAITKEIEVKIRIVQMRIGDYRKLRQQRHKVTRITRPVEKYYCISTNYCVFTSVKMHGDDAFQSCTLSMSIWLSWSISNWKNWYWYPAGAIKRRWDFVAFITLARVPCWIIPDLEHVSESVCYALHILFVSL